MAHNKGGDGHGVSHDVKKMSEQSEAARKRNAKEAKRREEIRSKEQAEGRLFIRLNEGRYTDIRDMVANIVGNYAFPGGNQPSAHFRVWSIKKPKTEEPMYVVAFESAQRGHELAGRVWDQEIFLPIWKIAKNGPTFVSNFEGNRKATQEMLCQYLSKILLEKQRIAQEEMNADAEAAEKLRKEAMRRELHNRLQRNDDPRVVQAVRKASDIARENIPRIPVAVPVVTSVIAETKKYSPAKVAKKTAPKVSGALQFSIAVFQGILGMYYLEIDGKRAYFRNEVVAGNKHITFFHVQKGFPENHFLSEIIKHHEELSLSLYSLRDEKVRSFANLKDEKEAREALRIFIRRIGKEKFNIKEATEKKEVVETPPVLEVIEKYKGHSRVRFSRGFLGLNARNRSIHQQ